MKHTICLSILSAAGLFALVGCSTPTEQMASRPQFLSTYNHLKQEDDLTWRYVAPGLLAQCNKFIIDPVQVLFNEVEGKPITPEQREKTAAFIHNLIVQSVSEKYP